MFSELNENDRFGINVSFIYNGIYDQNLDYTSNYLNSPPFKDEEKELLHIYSPFCDLVNKENSNINSNEGESTDFLSKQKQNINNEPLLYSFDNILDIFKRNEKNYRFKEIIETINNEECKNKMTFLEKKRKRRTFYDKNNNCKYELMDEPNEPKQNDIKIIDNNEQKNKRGRKTNKTQTTGIHGRKAADNIIKKVKVKIFEYPILFLNNILGNNNKNDKLLKLDYKYINKSNKEENLQFLNMSLKELFSKEISRKHITNGKTKDYNKAYINKIFENQPDDTILFIFNITFRDWLDLFTLKKNIHEIIIKYDYSDKKIDCERIQKSLYGVDNLLKNIMEDDEEYLSMFIFLLYNYERWFYKKSGRKAKVKHKLV